MPDGLGDAGALWLAGALVLAIAELAAPGVFLIFLAVAAAITGATVLALGEVPAAAQLASFAAWSVVAVLVGRRWYRDYPVAGGDALLNDRAGRIVGQTVLVEQAITGGHGRVVLGDGTWPARGPDAPAGTRMRVTAVDGGVLVVEPL